MTDWDKPSDALRRIASQVMAANMRECAECDHRHATDATCGYPLGSGARTCPCEK